MQGPRRLLEQARCADWPEVPKGGSPPGVRREWHPLRQHRAVAARRRPRRPAAGRQGIRPMTQCSIRSELAGVVFRIDLREGDAVAADDPVMVLESMKMEIPVLAPRAGRILKFLVKVGDAVREGQELAAFDTP